VKSTIRTAAKKIVKTIDSKEGKDLDKIQEYFLNFTKTIDTAAGKGIIKKNTAARKKSRLAKKINAAIASLKETA
jgi:small subunit ribosomal protein S20